MPATLNTIRALPLFSELLPEEATLLLQNCKLMDCKRGQLLFMHGDPITHFYAICTGTMQVFRETPDGHEITNDILIAGDTLNSDEVVARQSTHRVNARAVEDSTLLEIPIAWLRGHLRDFDHVAEKLLASIADRLHGAQLEAEQLSTMSAAQIVACYLQKLCVLYDFDPDGFDMPYTKTLIASRLRIEKETFSRTLPALRDQGITVSGRRVSIRDMRKADNFACGECSVAQECGTHRILHEKWGKLDANNARHGR
jgi:CRP/FNR family transcriptional regulator, dissimilatory nitrate respiration regulator